MDQPEIRVVSVSPGSGVPYEGSGQEYGTLEELKGQL